MIFALFPSRSLDNPLSDTHTLWTPAIYVLKDSIWTRRAIGVLFNFFFLLSHTFSCFFIETRSQTGIAETYPPQNYLKRFWSKIKSSLTLLNDIQWYI